MPPEKIQIKNIGELSDEERKLSFDIATHHYEKISRYLGNKQPLLIIYLKTHHATGKETKRKKFSISAELSDVIKLKAESFDWDLKAALHKTLLKLHHELEHRIRK